MNIQIFYVWDIIYSIQIYKGTKITAEEWDESDKREEINNL